MSGRNPWAFAASVVVGGAGLFLALRRPPAAPPQARPHPAPASQPAAEPPVSREIAGHRFDSEEVRQKVFALLREKKQEEALSQCLLGLQLKPRDPFFNRQVGLLLEERQADQRVVARYYLAALEADPRQSGALRMIAYLKKVQEGQGVAQAAGEQAR